MAKADPTLVKAAFTEASSRAGADVPNMKPLYDSTTDISAGYLKQITGIMTEFKNQKERERIALDKQLDGFKKIADQTLVSLFSLKEAMPNKVINAFEGRVKELQDEFELVNTLGDGDSSENRKARMRLMGELNKISQQTINLRKTTMDFSDRVSNNLLNTDVIQKDILEYAKSILDFKNLDESDVTVGYGRDGIIFKIDGEEFTINDLDEAFPGIDKDVATGFLDMTKATAKQGVFDGTGNNAVYNYKKDEQRGFFKGKINDKDDFQQYLTRLEGTDVPSFKEALLDDISIPVGILSNMFIDENGTRLEIGQALSEMDYNGDGVITEADGNFNGVDMENFKKNMDIMVDVLTNIKNPAFDLQTSKDLLTDYYIGGTRTIDGFTQNIMGIDEQIYNKNYQNTIEEKQNKSNNYDKSGYEFNGSMDADGRYKSRTVQDIAIDDVLAGRPVSHNGINWEPDGRGNYSAEGWDNDLKKNVTRTMSAQDLLYKEFGFIERMRTKYKNDFDFSGEVDDTYNYEPETVPESVKDIIPYDYNESVLTGPNGDVNFDDLWKDDVWDIVLVLQHDLNLDHTFNENKGNGGPIPIKLYESNKGGGVLVIHVQGETPKGFKPNKDGMKKLAEYLNGDEFVGAYWPAGS